MTTITLPPLYKDDETAHRMYGLRISVGPIEVEFIDEGAGCYAVIKMDLDGEWTVDPDEMLAFAQWLKETCNTLDYHNGTRIAQEKKPTPFNPLYPGGWHTLGVAV
jgi:hypothetical protein